jgi:hypothetical protein
MVELADRSLYSALYGSLFCLKHSDPPSNRDCPMQQIDIFCIELMEDGIVHNVMSRDLSCRMCLRFSSTPNNLQKVADTIYI